MSVIAFPVKPKSMKRTYRGADIVLTFIPKAPRAEQWKWKVTITTKMEYEDVAASDVKALRAAEKFIDTVKGKK